MKDKSDLQRTEQALDDHRLDWYPMQEPLGRLAGLPSRGIFY